MAEPVLWRAGLWEFRGQHLLQLLALLCGFLVATAVARGAGVGWPDWRDAVLWTLPEALLAARVGHVLLHPDLYLLAPARIWHLWDGGWSLGAGLAAGGAALWWYARRRVSLGWHLADGAAAGLAVGQLILAAGAMLAAPSPLGVQLLVVYLVRTVVIAMIVRASALHRLPGALVLVYLIVEGLAGAVSLAGSTATASGWGTIAWLGVAIAAGLWLVARCRGPKRIGP